ncbi:hypothetical protein D3C78_784640 [compost metagenome]
MLQCLRGDALQQLFILVAHGRGHQGRQLFGDHFTPLQQLGLQIGQLHPGEIAAQDQGHQAGRQQGQQEHATFDPQFFQHATLLLSRCSSMTDACIRHAAPAQCSDLPTGNLGKISTTLSPFDRHWQPRLKERVARGGAILNNQ